MADQYAQELHKTSKFLQIKVNFSGTEKQKDKLYDNERLDPRKTIKDGELCDISQIKGSTNVPEISSVFFVNQSDPLS